MESNNIRFFKQHLTIEDDARSDTSQQSNVSCQTELTNIYPRVLSQGPRTVLIPLDGRFKPDAGPLGRPIKNYFTAIKLGTPQQIFRVQFELALDNHFLPHYSWRPWHSALRYKHGFRASKSQTSNKSQSYYLMEYQNCQLLGRLNEDNVVFEARTMFRERRGNLFYRPTSVGTRINFIAVDMAGRDDFSRVPFHGFIGIGPKPQSDTIGCRNLACKMQEDQLIDRPLISLWLDSKRLKGEILFGGTDRRRYKEPIHWHISDTERWTIKVHALKIGSIFIDQCLPSLVQLSSAINEIQGPAAAIERIHSQFKIRHDPKRGIPWLRYNDTHNLPDIVIFTDVAEIRLEPISYLGKLGNSYHLQIIAGSSDREWIFGTTFLQNFYSVYDVLAHKVGLASLRNERQDHIKSRGILCSSKQKPISDS